MADSDMRPLTALRFVAALHVMLLHEHVDFWPGAPAWVNVLLDRTAALSFFYLLSGFILVYVYHAYPFAEKGPGRFLVSRLARVYPVYLLGLLLFLPIFIARAVTMYDLELGGVLAVVGVNVALLQAWFTEPQWFINRPGWTVSAILFFSLTFAPVLRFLRNRSRIFLWGFALAAWMASQVLVWVFENRIGIEGHDIERLHKNPVVRWPEFLMGMVGGLLWVRRSGTPNWIRHRAVVPWVGALTLALFVFLPAVWSNYIHNGLLMPLLALVLVSSAVSEGWWKPLLVHPFMLLLGRASFSFYILHLVVGNYLSGVFIAASALLSGGASTWTPRLATNVFENTTFILLDLMILIPLSIYVYNRFEEPMRARLKSWYALQATSKR